MRTRKNLFTGIAAASLLAIAAPIANQQVSAAQSVSSTKKLSKNAYVYNAEGKRVKNYVLKSGKTVKVIGTITIGKKKFYKIGKNQYVIANNFVPAKKYSAIKKSYIYNSAGQRISKKYVSAGTTIKSLGIKTIKGQKYLKIGKDQYVRLSNLTLITPPTQPISANTNPNNNQKPSQPVNNTQPSSSTAAPSVPSAGTTAPSAPSNPISSSNNDFNSWNTDDDGDLYTIVSNDILIYDKDGNHVLGKFLNKGYKFYQSDINKIVNINGTEYYELDLFDEDYYIKASDLNGKSKLPAPATNGEFTEDQKLISGQQAKYPNGYDIGTKYDLSSKKNRSAYDYAYRTAFAVVNDSRSSSNDLKRAMSELSTAYNNLDGKKIQLSGTKEDFEDNSYTLTAKEKADILALANKVTDSTNAHFSDNSTITYTIDNQFKHMTLLYLADFKASQYVSQKEIDDFKQKIKDKYKYGYDIGDKYSLSSPDARKAYDDAFKNSQVGTWMTVKQFNKIKNNLIAAYNNLDGVRVSIAGNQDDYTSGAYQLTDKEKTDILALVNKAEGATDAHFSESDHIEFSRDGKNQKTEIIYFISFNKNVAPASKNEFDDLKELLSSTYKSTYDLGALYMFSSKKAKDEYSSAYYSATKIVANNASSSLAISKAKSDLQKAYKQLDGKAVLINTDFYNFKNYKLTDQEKHDILALVNKCEGATDATFSKDEKSINYTFDGRLWTTETSYYVDYKY
ncbi:SLAP domain-containing protein [Lactobacillus sp. ESL0703]|uniref:SLAP domain-containing protein n=1 Tax=Lactobacillus sp. ESL0703 TaxID=2983218 RepID=UPI0023F7EF5C|nr:SLAP domain-containing protein [Lactobacillus sp. ESL0703]MDF7668497.1 SLAP domain-containing protein [Lactobacillus sp. ESL0703]